MEKFTLENKEEKIIEGDGFFIKENAKSKTSASATNSGFDLIGVELKPGESTDSARAEFEKNKESKTEKIYLSTEDWIVSFIEPILAKHGTYSETLIIKNDGKLNTETRLDGVVPILANEVNTPAELYSLAKTISDKNPEYHFDFETDPEGKWIKYIVSKVQ